ncbi:MAG: hypothetical protein WB492_13840 [Christiangramia sp.]
MKHNASLVSNFVENSFLFKGASFFINPEKHSGSNSFENSSSEKNSIFSAFWEKLIHKPHSFTQTPNTSISTIMQESGGISTSGIIKSILSEKLNLPKDSEALIEAIEKSNKIFHEDYPADFILEYQGERLGMALLDICYDSNRQPKPVYKFNENLKSFSGLF